MDFKYNEKVIVTAIEPNSHLTGMYGCIFRVLGERGEYAVYNPATKKTEWFKNCCVIERNGLKIVVHHTRLKSAERKDGIDCPKRWQDMPWMPEEYR